MPAVRHLDLNFRYTAKKASMICSLFHFFVVGWFFFFALTSYTEIVSPAAQTHISQVKDTNDAFFQSVPLN